jgi:hypothetical protein
MIIVYWDVTHCILADVCVHFRRMCRFNLHSIRWSEHDVIYGITPKAMKISNPTYW